ncbi:ABC-three component system middle component 1 [Pedobacter chitinilyticus]|uniref:Rad50/SbcC-type AAA domain-containing protein n=1 Tax=Pedobacter chitinilyticus TaxID=2233776 RepID=A0A443Z287_9SPHI|nr:ABC-three component system middle component 1 [Pedobacter chitinilyticus]RWU10647.1 hypothetical protein DPV69_04725 [Pedobacter chitinilyticus]
MDNIRIIDTAKKILPDLKEINKGIYRGTLNIEDKVAGVCFIDLLNDKKEDFGDYQEQLLSSEFYSNPGALQWNYYLFLLNDQFSEEEVNDIENDDKYARKYVLDEKEFTDFFHIDLAEKTVQPDIVSEWKKLLQEVDLQEVYTDETYVSVMDRFSQNQTRKEAIASVKKAVGDVGTVKFIDRLLLKENYRLFPKSVRDFSFGKVNLFKGINGVGKTSVFEGIELMLCGRSARNVHQVNPNGCLEAIYNGSSKMEQYQGTNQALFQARDLKWYSTTYNRGNTLFNSFNRFNYFNADAAHSFSSSKTEGEVMDALKSIILGPEFNHIQERCNKMFERIRPEYRKLKDAFDAAKNEIVLDNKVVGAYLEPQNLKYIREKVAQDMQNVGFHKKGLDVDTELTAIEDLNNQLGVLLQNFADDNFFYDTLSAIQLARDKFDGKKAAFDGLIDQVKALAQKSATIQGLQKDLEKKIQLLERGMEYLAEGRYMELEGVTVKQREQQLIKNKTDFVAASISQIDTSSYRSSQNIDAFVLAEKSRDEQIQNDIKTVKQEIQRELDKMGKVEGLIKELKTKGKLYLEVAPEATSCPLCETSFERSKLENSINLLISSEIDGSERFDEKNKKVSAWTEESTHIQKKLTDIAKIKDAYQSYFGLDAPIMSFDETLLKVSEIIGKSTDVANELERLNDTIAFGNLSGKSEVELAELKVRISQAFNDELKLDVLNVTGITNKLSALRKEFSANSSELERNTDERYKKGLDVKLLLGLPPEEQADAKLAARKLEEEDKQLALFAGYAAKLTSLLAIGDTSKFSEIKNNSDVLKQAIQSFRNTLSGEIVVKQARERLDKNNKMIALNSEKLERFRKAFERLTELTSDGAAKKIEEFFVGNLGEIIDIFKSIHVPKEFSDLKFESDRLVLIDQQGKRRFVTEISTGQRSALALSIFLSLNNKLTNGPDIIMFDDPVAFIDDLNALSFLDYLRLNALKSGKQIFFATANTRLAHLFEKKFAFLEDDFRQWQLERN